MYNIFLYDGVSAQEIKDREQYMIVDDIAKTIEVATGKMVKEYVDSYGVQNINIRKFGSTYEIRPFHLNNDCITIKNKFFIKWQVNKVFIWYGNKGYIAEVDSPVFYIVLKPMHCTHAISARDFECSYEDFIKYIQRWK